MTLLLVQPGFFNYGVYLSQYTETADIRGQLETAAFLQLITKSPSSVPPRTKHRRCILPPALPAYTGQMGQTLHRALIRNFYSTSMKLARPWPVSSLSLPPHNCQCYCFIKAVQDLHRPYPVFRYYLHISRFLYLGTGTANAIPFLEERKQMKFLLLGPSV